MNKIKKILLRKEYAGYILGVASFLIVTELPGPYNVLLLLVIVFGGLPLARRYLN